MAGFLPIFKVAPSGVQRFDERGAIPGGLFVLEHGTPNTQHPTARPSLPAGIAPSLAILGSTRLFPRALRRTLKVNLTPLSAGWLGSYRGEVEALVDRR